jgi:copper chaperone CopZ
MSERLDIVIEGMHCDGCVRRVTRALQKKEGIESLTVESGSAKIRFDEARSTKQELVDAINKVGFVAREA